ncbi:hypothetical protein PVK06_027526 [Gossypium arboreum]|uniref:Uncharacterized protein n=1 Tax=Gossypium arboreum TaxID=29729 RepID=A0ABR0P0I2_GOSAR|nr:hypothetical protein PVK06_027526 [Gossypium arboreum]
MRRVYNHTQGHSIKARPAGGWANHHRISVVREKVNLSMAILGKIPNKFKGGWILINWLEKIFDKLLDDSTEEVIQQYAQAFIMRLIRGILMLDKSRNLVYAMQLDKMLIGGAFVAAIVALVANTIFTS